MEFTSARSAAFLVEDSAVIRDNLILALDELADTQVVAYAESQSEALDWLQRHPDGWALAVIDMYLKEGTGIAVLQRCRLRQPRQRAVVLTHYADRDIRAQCLALGADAVFDKATELDAFYDYCLRA